MAKYDYRGDPALGSVLTYWCRLCGTRAMPRRTDIRPREIAEQLPYILLVDVVDGGEDFRYRLIGTAMVVLDGVDYTGCSVDQRVTGVRYTHAVQNYRNVCTLKVPMFARDSYTTFRHTPLITNRLYLPLSDDGQAVTTILCAFSFEGHSEHGLWKAADLDLKINYLEPVELEIQPAA